MFTKKKPSFKPFSCPVQRLRLDFKLPNHAIFSLHSWIKIRILFLGDLHALVWAMNTNGPDHVCLSRSSPVHPNFLISRLKISRPQTQQQKCRPRVNDNKYLFITCIYIITVTRSLYVLNRSVMLIIFQILEHLQLPAGPRPHFEKLWSSQPAWRSIIVAAHCCQQWQQRPLSEHPVTPCHRPCCGVKNHYQMSVQCRVHIPSLAHPGSW